MFIYLNKKGQNTLEYAIIIAVIVAALIAMNAYIKRGVQGRLKSATNDIGDQFSPQTAFGTSNTHMEANSDENITGGAAPTTTVNTTQDQTKNVTENVGTLSDEWFP
jgi:Flp pilus assembly pilin Flp